MILGAGSYGQVQVRDGKAIKTFAKLSHLIQEYIALRYLNDCKYVVKSKGVNFEKLELHMELYDNSLRKWYETKIDNGGISDDEIMIILRDVLMGLVELHDRQLAHGDLKPGNILIRNQPLGAVLGDCGFVSIAKYAKVDRTAPVYKDPIVSHDSSHDMFSFGICFLEMIAKIKINKQVNYEKLRKIIMDNVENRDYRKILYNLLHEDKDRRPTARDLLYRLFSISPEKWINPHVDSSGTGSRLRINIPKENIEYIRALIKNTAYKYEINRGQRGYGALIAYIQNHNIDPSMYDIYVGVTLMTLSATFGKSGYRVGNASKLADGKFSTLQIYEILNNILSDVSFINIILAP